MFANLKQLWYDLTHKGGETMPTTESATTRKLKEQVKTQATEISSLRNRISELVDDMHAIRNDVNRFKTQVADDIKHIIENMHK